MKPTNTDKKCEATGSKCVIWDGPDIECVGICKGDTVTDVVYALGKKVCELETLVDISWMNLSCLEATYGAIPDIRQLLGVLVANACSNNQ